MCVNLLVQSGCLLGYVKSLYFDLDGNTTALTVTHMRHFTWYTVNIWACRAQHVNESAEAYEPIWCSDRTYNTFRTPERGRQSFNSFFCGGCSAPNARRY